MGIMMTTENQRMEHVHILHDSSILHFIISCAATSFGRALFIFPFPFSPFVLLSLLTLGTLYLTLGTLL